MGGLSVNVSDYDGRTALHLAAAEGRLKVAEYLVNKEANILFKDRWNATPLDEARRAGSKEMIDLLEKHLAESSKQDSESNQSDVQDDSIEAA